MDRVTNIVSERPVVIFSKSSCCMCHTIKTLFSEFGVNPAVHELDEIPRGKDIEQALSRLGCNPSVPAVFIGGEFVGGTNEVMSLHLNRTLIPMLRNAGALWKRKVSPAAWIMCRAVPVHSLIKELTYADIFTHSPSMLSQTQQKIVPLHRQGFLFEALDDNRNLPTDEKQINQLPNKFYVSSPSCLEYFLLHQAVTLLQ
ncbi:hypothetical protein RIF29_40546 [Crotalaria pallida]|uniref:Glutaredoxin domain-containing protein n=1 Tax=Crotalaria pallida TaxID=3830 RepID=A0AAN9E5Q6_CROPI